MTSRTLPVNVFLIARFNNFVAFRPLILFLNILQRLNVGLNGLLLAFDHVFHIFNVTFATLSLLETLNM